MIEEDGYGIYPYISKGDQALNLDTHVGTRWYLHSSAVGKSVLAEMDDRRVEQITNRHGLPAETPNTVTTEQNLLDELDEILERGVAFNGEKRAEGIRCVAAPITNTEKNLLGGVSVSAPSTRLKSNRFREKIPEKV